MSKSKKNFTWRYFHFWVYFRVLFVWKKGTIYPYSNICGQRNDSTTSPAPLGTLAYIVNIRIGLKCPIFTNIPQKCIIWLGETKNTGLSFLITVSENLGADSKFEMLQVKQQSVTKN